MILPASGPLSLIAPVGLVNLAPRQNVTVTIMASPAESLGFGVYTANMALSGQSLFSSIGVRLDLVTDRVTELIVQIQDERT